MTCQECEVLLAAGETASVSGHLAGCPDCRMLADDLRENAAVLASMREEYLPPVVIPTRQRRPWIWTGIGAAAAAAVILAIALRKPPAPVPPPPSPVVAAVMPAPTLPQPPKAVATSVHRHRRSRHPQETPAEPLLVKFLTDDPGVVIYWLVDSKPKEGAL